MKKLLTLLCVIATALLLPNIQAQAQTSLYAEGADISSNISSPTFTITSAGTYTVSGNLGTPSDGADYFQITVNSGLQLTSATYSVSGGGGFSGGWGFAGCCGNSISGNGSGSFSGASYPLSAGTYGVQMSAGFSVGNSWVTTFTVTSTAVAPSITSNPPNRTVCSGSGTSFSISANNATSYQWQVSTNGGSTYSNLSNTGVYSGATTTTLSLSSTTTGMNSYRYRCIATGSASPAATSNSGLLTVNSSPSISSHPAGSSSICAGTNTSFSITASGVSSYQWQVSTNGGSTYTNLSNAGVYSGVTTSSLSITGATTGMNSYRYRCVTTNSCGSTTSNAGVLSVSTVPIIVSHPPDRSICEGTSTFFNLIMGSAATFQWQVSTNGGSTYTNLSNAGVYSGVTTSSLSVTGATTGMNGYRYRCVTTNSCGNNTTNSGLLTVNPAPVINTQPSNTLACVGSTGGFTISATGATSYQWAVSTNGGSTYSYLSNVSPYSNVTTATLTISGFTAGMNGYLYRCAATNSCGTVHTSAVTLTVDTPPAVSTHPSNSIICAGTATSFTVSATGSSLLYQWQVSTNGGSTYSNLSNVSPYSNVNSATLNLSNATTSGINGYMYRCVVSNNGCSSAATSNGATLTVNTAPAISSNPANIAVCNGAGTSFSVSATGTGLSYQWQESTNSGSTWSNVSNTGIYSGATSSSLSLSGTTAGMNSYQYRCVVSGTCTPAATSNVAILTVNTLPAITSHPVNSTVCAGAGTSFSVSATGSGLTYQWQVSTNSGSTWGNMSNGGGYSNVTTATMSVPAAITALSGYQFRCVVSGTCTPSVTSNAATITVNDVPNITGTSQNNPLCEGNASSFGVTSTTAVSYQWQTRVNSGASWANVSNGGIYSGATTSSLSLSTKTASMAGYEYRCVLTNTCGNSNSTTFTLVALGLPSISSHPSNSTICDGNNTSFTVSATGAGLTYQWELSSNGGSTWSSVTNTGIYTGATTATLNLTAASTAVHNYQYRCIVSGSCSPSVTSNPALLNINTLPTVTASPSSNAICSGGNTSFSASATGTSIAYQWQVSTNSGSTWSNVTNGGIYSNATTSTLSVTGATTSENGYQYRCNVSGTCTPSVNTSAATLTIYTAPAITSNPSNSTICENTNTSFTVAATGTALTYQWRVSSDGGSTWTNLTNTGIYSGVTTATLSLTGATTAVHNYSYSCVISGTCTPSVTSGMATLSIQTAPVITSQPNDSTICEGNNSSFSVAAIGTNLAYQWQLSSNSGSTWSNVTNTGIYSGATTATLSLTVATTAVHNYQYRCVVSGTCSPSQTSNAATLIINTSPNVTVSPANSTICSGNNTSFSVTATGTGLTYQWQVNNGGGWNNMFNAGIYSGVTTSTLNITGATVSKNNYQYRCVVSGVCPPSVISGVGTLTVNTPHAITTHPVNTLICNGDNTGLSVVTSGTVSSYQWQVSTNNGGTWSNVTNTGIYSGATTNSLSLTNATTTVNGYQYRCVVSGPCATAQTSNAATMSVGTFATPTLQPTNQTACSGNNAVFTTAATSTVPVSYQWQHLANGTNWLNLSNGNYNGGNYSGVNTSTLTVNGTTIGLNGRQYRCVYNTGCTPAISSNTVSLTVYEAPAILTASPAITICESQQTNLYVTTNITAGAITYQWQVNTGSGWTNLSNGGNYTNTTARVMTISNTPLSFNSNQYRCVVSGSCAPNAVSTPTLLTVQQAVVITTQPKTLDSICSGGSTTISTAAIGTGLTYQWQVNTGSGWNNLSNAGVYSGATGNTLSISGLTESANYSTYQYRCKIVGTCSSLSTTTSTLKVLGKPNITSSPNTQVVCDSSNLTMNVQALGGNLTYQWQVNSGSGWSNLSNGSGYSNVTTKVLGITAALSMSGNQYRCRVSGTCTPSANSGTATLTVNPNLTPSITIAASDVDICNGTTVTFTASPVNVGSSPSYQWYINGNPTGPNSATFSTSSLSNNDQVKCKVTSSYMCATAAEATSNPIAVKVTQYSTPTISITSSSGTVECSGVPITYRANTTNGGTPPDYEWQVNGQMQGANADSFVINTLQNGDQVRCILTSTIKCPSPKNVTSNTITMTINKTTKSSIVIGANPDTSICEGDTITLYSFYTNGGTTPQFQWMRNGTDIPGATNATLETDMIQDGDLIECRFISSALCVFPEISKGFTFDVAQILNTSVDVQVSYNGNNSYTFTALPVNGGSSPAFQWFKNGVIIQGQTGSTYTTSSLQQFDKIYVKMTSSNPCVSSKAVDSRLTSTGISNVNSNLFSDLGLYPNPNTGQFSITGKLKKAVANKDVVVRIINTVGQTVYQEVYNTGGTDVNLKVDLKDNIANGTYRASIIVDGDITNINFVLNR